MQPSKKNTETATSPETSTKPQPEMTDEEFQAFAAKLNQAFLDSLNHGVLLDQEPPTKAKN